MNQRPIKFRAYHPERKTMFYDIDISCENSFKKMIIDIIKEVKSE